jgi:hypothetical protein
MVEVRGFEPLSHRRWPATPHHSATRFHASVLLNAPMASTRRGAECGIARHSCWRIAAERCHALGKYLPPPRCRAQRRDLYTFYICCRWDPHPANHGTDDEGHRWVPVEP